MQAGEKFGTLFKLSVLIIYYNRIYEFSTLIIDHSLGECHSVFHKSKSTFGYISCIVNTWMMSTIKFKTQYCEHFIHSTNILFGILDWISFAKEQTLLFKTICFKVLRVWNFFWEHLLNIDPPLQVVWKIEVLKWSFPLELITIEVTTRYHNKLMLKDAKVKEELVKLLKGLLKSGTFLWTHFIRDTCQLSAEWGDFFFNCKSDVLMKFCNHLLLFHINDHNWKLNCLIEFDVGFILWTVALEIVHA